MKPWDRNYKKLSDYALFLGLTIRYQTPSIEVSVVDGKTVKKVSDQESINRLSSYTNLVDAAIASLGGEKLPKETVVIDSSEDSEIRTYSLAHELGHYIQVHRLDPRWTNIDFKMAYVALQKGEKVSRAWRAKIIEYETEAWDLGESLLEFLGISKTKRFQAEKKRSLRTFEVG